MHSVFFFVRYVNIRHSFFFFFFRDLQYSYYKFSEFLNCENVFVRMSIFVKYLLLNTRTLEIVHVFGCVLSSYIFCKLSSVKIIFWHRPNIDLIYRDRPVLFGTLLVGRLPLFQNLIRPLATIK